MYRRHSSFCSLLLTLALGTLAGDNYEALIESAKAKHGAWGERAAHFLVEHMPESDRGQLDPAFLAEQLDYAARAREEFPWAKDIPEAIYFNDVLPYAVFDEPRDPWRPQFYELAGELVKDATTASEAAQILNRDFFKAIETHYSRERLRVNQSPKESMEQGKASCTELSILLVAACRSVGVPARAAGTPMWWNDSGNHTWVEIWDGEWKFTGADEYNAKGLNHAWFAKNASKAEAANPRKAIYATSWKREGTHFPLVWSPRSRAVAAVNVTGRYTAESEGELPGVGIRLLEGKERVSAKGWLTRASGYPLQEFRTKAGRADYNDTPRLEPAPGERYRWRFLIDGKHLETAAFTYEASGHDIVDVQLETLAPAPDFSDPARALSKTEAARAIDFVYESIVAERMEAMQAEQEAKTITLGGMVMPWKEATFGEAPRGQRSLWISMHGGGGAPPRVNDSQWANQIKLYQPAQGIYVAPRAPTDTWNLWHQEHIDPMFGRLIENMVALRGVDPDRVYLMGYSAGGDGVWQLAPRMADRYAAAATMAGHPNESKLLGLRNLPFAIFMGGNDKAYKRAQVAREKSAAMAELQKADPEGYVHLSRIYEGMGHWMNKKDAEALPWMQQFTRNPWPEKLVWYQDDVTHDRFYWIGLAKGAAEKGQTIRAELTDRTIRISGDVPEGTRVLLSDALLNLDDPVEIRIEGKAPLRVRPQRTLSAIRESLEQRLDKKAAYTATVSCPF